MARVTLASLQAVIDQQASANTALHAEIRALRTELAAYQVAQRPSRQAPAPRAPRAAWQLPAHMAAARELAMRTGTSVKVG